MVLRVSRPFVLCDTNILIPLLRHRIENQKRRPKNQLPALSLQHEIQLFGEDHAMICPIVTGELYARMFKSEISATKQLLKKFKNYPLDKEVSLMFEHLMYSYRDRSPAVADTLIAAIGIVAQAEIWTDNQRHFNYFEEVKLYRPLLNHKDN